MAKVCEELYPKGTYKNQLSDGYYMEGFLKENIDIMAERVVDDMQFVGVISGRGTVRNGKSTLAQQIGFYFNYKVNKMHKLNNKFTAKNIVFKSNELIDTAFELPPYSVLVLDEGDDLTAQHYSRLAIRLRKFFRKCGQLNLFILLLIPDFFELPRPYAVARSTFLIDVSFQGKFERGFFDFYSLDKKRELYYKGKRYGDYKCVNSNFQGRFINLYTVDEEEYRKKKYDDMFDDKGDNETQYSRKELNLKYIELIKKMEEAFDLEFEDAEIAVILGVDKSSIGRYKRELYERNDPLEAFSDRVNKKLENSPT